MTREKPVRERAQMELADLQLLRERVQREFGKPALAVPTGTTVVGTVARLETAAGKSRAIVEHKDFVCIVSIGDIGGLSLVGKRVALENRGGSILISERAPGLAVKRPTPLER